LNEKKRVSYEIFPKNREFSRLEKRKLKEKRKKVFFPLVLKLKKKSCPSFFN